VKYTEIKILKAIVIKPYLIWVEFNDGKIKEIDLEPIMHGSLFGQLKNLELFKEMRLNSEIHTI